MAGKKQSAKKVEPASFSPPPVQRSLKARQPLQPLVATPPRKTLTNEELEEILVGWITFDQRRLYDVRGELLPVVALDDFTAMCLAGLKVREEFERGEEGHKELVGYTKELTVERRIEAMKLLAKIRGLDRGKTGDEDQSKLNELEAIFRAGPVELKK